MEQGQEIQQDHAPAGKRPKSKAFYIAIAGAVAVLFIVIAFVLQEEPRDPYKDGLRAPEQVLSDIQQLNSSVMLDCMKKGLNDPDWTCPKVTQNQTILIIARLMANYVEYNDATVLGKHYSEETSNTLNTTLRRTVQRMRAGECVPQTQINLHPNITTKMEQGEFVQPCANGWSLARPWHEIISRQEPPLTPDSTFFQRHLPVSCSHEQKRQDRGRPDRRGNFSICRLRHVDEQ